MGTLRGRNERRRVTPRLAVAVVGCLVAVALAVLSPRAGRAEEPTPGSGLCIPCFVYGVRFGVLAHDVDHLWSRSRAEGGADLNLEIVFRRPGIELLGGAVLTNLGGSLNLAGRTSKAYAGLLWERIFSPGLFFNTGLGLALHDGRLDTDDPDRKSLGSRLLFRVPLEAGVILSPRYRLSLFFDHVSNGYLAHPNEGLDTLGLRLGLQF